MSIKDYYFYLWKWGKANLWLVYRKENQIRVYFCKSLKYGNFCACLPVSTNQGINLYFHSSELECELGTRWSYLLLSVENSLWGMQADFLVLSIYLTAKNYLFLKTNLWNVWKKNYDTILNSYVKFQCLDISLFDCLPELTPFLLNCSTERANLWADNSKKFN